MEGRVLVVSCGELCSGCSELQKAGWLLKDSSNAATTQTAQML